MKLIAYEINGNGNPLRKAPGQRRWMDATGQRFAYRCLPLTIANSAGWEICCPHAVRAVWNGGDGPEDIEVEGPEELAVSHFGFGVLTFFPGYVFRTEPGYDMVVTGPFNRPKSGAYPLTGIVETDWAPYHFTMNWQMLEPEKVVAFDVGEPFCQIYPQQRNLLTEIRPEIRDLTADPELEHAHKDWYKKREQLLERHASGDIDWDKNYRRGRMPDGRPADVEHRSHLSLYDFKDNRNKDS